MSTTSTQFFSWKLYIVPAILGVAIPSFILLNYNCGFKTWTISSNPPKDGGVEKVGEDEGRQLPKMPKQIPAKVLGIKTVYPADHRSGAAKNHNIDIVAVHGLGANPTTTWTAKKDTEEEKSSLGSRAPNGKKASYVNWLSDPSMLPSGVPNARIMVFNHDSQWYGEEAVSVRLDPLAASLARSIISERKDCPSRPLIIIGHSLGGLIIEKALLHHEASRHLVPATTAVILLGTPHAGSEYIGLPEILERIIRGGTHIEHSLLRSLRPENEGILDTVNNFAEMANSNGISVACFYETKRSVIARMFDGDTDKAVLVDEKSATLRSWPCYPLPLDHYTLNKFADPDDGNWRALQRVILDCCEEAAEKMLSREGGSSLIPRSLVPYDRDLKFIGRVEILSQLEKLHENNNRVALHGIGGVGKSQIAIEYAYRFREKHPNSWVFWVFAGTVEKFEKAYQEIATALELPGADDPKIDAMALVTEWLNQERPKASWLMILDNLDDMAVLNDLKSNTNQKTVKHGRSSSVAQISTVSRRTLKEYLPFSARGTMLVTTRVRTAAYNIVGEHDRIIEIPIMSEEEALRLLQVKLNPIFDESERPACIKLVNELDRLPLAITQASAYIGNNTQMTVSDYLTLFSEQSNQAKLLDEESGNTRRENDVPNAVSNTWLISFDQIAQKEGPTGQAAIRLLYTMCFFDRHGIPDWLLRENGNAVGFTKTVGMLTGYCLITVEKGKSYGMHRLVQIVTRTKVASEKETDHWKKEALRILKDRFPSGELETWKECEQLVPHFQAVKDYKLPDESSEEVRATLFSKKAHFDERKGMWETVLGGYKEEFAIRNNLKMNGPEHPKTLTALHKLGWANFSLDKVEIAKDITERVLTSRQQVIGPEHEDTLETLNNLAFILSDEDLSRQALEGRQRVLGDDLKTAESLHNHAIILTDNDKSELALEFNERALKMMNKFLKSDHQDILLCRTMRAGILRDLNRFKEAEETAREVLQICEAVLGLSHAQTIATLSDCALYCSLNKDYASAEKYAIRSLEARQKHVEFGPNHPETIRVMSDLGNYQGKQKKIDAAEKTYQAALSKAIEIFGPEHDETCLCRADLGLLFLKANDGDRAVSVLNEYIFMVKSKDITNGELLELTTEVAGNLEELDYLNEAELLWEAVVTGYQNSEIKGQGHNETTKAVNKLAFLYKRQKKYPQAEELLRRAYQYRTDARGPVHESTLFSCRQLIDVLKKQGKYKEAEVVRQKEFLSIATPESQLAKQRNLHVLARNLFKSKRLAEAEEVAIEIFESRRETLGLSNVDTLKSRHLLGCIWLDQYRDAEAEVCFREVYEERLKLLGPEDNATIAAVEDLLVALEGQEKMDEAAEFEKLLPKDALSGTETS